LDLKPGLSNNAHSNKGNLAQNALRVAEQATLKVAKKKTAHYLGLSYVALPLATRKHRVARNVNQHLSDSAVSRRGPEIGCAHEQ
jgi:hypothetical protein